MLDLILLSFQTLPLAHIARAEVFFSEEQVTHTLFPTAVFKPKTVTLTDDQIKAIEKASDESVREKVVKAYVAPTGETVIIDRVLGKHEFITYAVGIQKDGSIKQIEVMEYKETYGGDVKKESWRKQFVGKTKSSPVKLKEDIQNISGATLSSLHLTNGTRRVLQTYDVIRAQL